ncbi:MAG: hypothetical protein Q4D04_00825 [Clostridia bacterium]|nr:hypothetical protein [Clostridia bacterium]
MKNEKTISSLPYVNNAGSFLITIALNAGLVFLFLSGRELTVTDVTISMVCCGVGTAGINVALAGYIIGKMRMAGQLPPNVPQPRAIRLLPGNKWLLAISLAVVFGVLTPSVNWLIIKFYEIESFTLIRHIVWQSAFSCLVTVIVMRVVVLRLIQPDLDVPGQPEQKGSSNVIDPLPRFSALKNWFNTIIDDFGFNMIVGLLFGSTMIVDHNVVITPTTRAGIVISALILGMIITLRMVYPVLGSIRALKLSGELKPLPAANKFFSRLPESPLRLAMALSPVIMLLSLAVLWTVLSFFGFEVLNFFQFFVIRTIFVTVLTKGVVRVAVLRYIQPESTPRR